ncbi:MAG TPA: hypothetical protein VMF30_15220 [Pirellulales bacterium]|nr:hypothetical protein [Pirellulales bacterium]
MNLTWTTSISAGALHAARALSLGQSPVDLALAGRLRVAAEAVAAAVAATGLPAKAVWRHLFPLAASLSSADHSTADSAKAYCAVAARAMECLELRATGPMVDSLGVALADFEAAYVAALPHAASEMPLRIEPLRSQWEARGPGLLWGVRRMTSVDWLVPAATIVLVPPLLGGAGQAHPAYNFVTFEALLANPIARLPEVLRLGWLLAQLNPALALGELEGRAAAWGLLPVVLAAAEEVELAHADRADFDLAAVAWLNFPSRADTVWQWWGSHLQGQHDWRTGLAELARLLAKDD